MERKKLYKKNDDRKICGVCSGIAEYLNIDPTVLRIVWAVGSLCVWPGVIAYFICALIMPNEFEN